MGRAVQIVDNHLTDPAEILWENPEDSKRAIAKYRGIFTMLDRTDEGPDTWELGTRARPGLELDMFNKFEKEIDGETTVDVTAPDGTVTTFTDEGGSVKR